MNILAIIKIAVFCHSVVSFKMNPLPRRFSSLCRFISNDKNDGFARSFQQARDDGFGTRARNAAINATVGDVIVPLCSNLEMRQSLANRGIYAGVEYKICSISLLGQSIDSLEGLERNMKEQTIALVKPAYPLRDYLERDDWPVPIQLIKDVPFWLSKSTYQAGTAVGTLVLSGFSLSIAALVAFFVRFVTVPTASMIPTLNPGNIVLVTRSTLLSPPKVGDIVFFNAPSELQSVVDGISSEQLADKISPKGKQFLKRVVAIPGETVGVKRSEPFVKLSDTNFRFDLVGPYIQPELFQESSWDRTAKPLGKHEYFVAGDNGYRSVDSRVWGPLQDKYIIGKAQWSIWPNFGPLLPSTQLKEITRD